MGTSPQGSRSGAGAWRVSQLAKQLGVSSTVLLDTIRESGEYVRGPSSTITIPVARWATQQVRERFPEAVLAATIAAAETATRPPQEPVTFWQEAERLATARGPGRTPGKDGARRIRTIRVADLPPMARQLLRCWHAYHRPSIDDRLAETLKGQALAWAREGFDAQAATPWIRAHIAPASAGYLARHRISPQALDHRIPVSGHGDMPLSVAIRSGLVSAGQACRILEARRSMDATR